MIIRSTLFRAITMLDSEKIRKKKFPLSALRFALIENIVKGTLNEHFVWHIYNLAMCEYAQSSVPKTLEQ